jgi:hypothetical protein
MAKKDLDKPQKIKTPLEELEVLANLKEKVEWAIAKRWINRYILNLQKVSFRLDETLPNFVSRHAELIGQAVGLRTFVRAIEKAGKKLDEMEEKKKNV